MYSSEIQKISPQCVNIVTKMSVMPSFVGVLELKIILDRVNREVESVLSNVQRFNAVGSSDVAIQEAIIETDTFLRSHPTAAENLYLLANSLGRLNCKLQTLAGQADYFCNNVSNIDRNASITSDRGSLVNQPCSCETNSKKETEGINTNVVLASELLELETESYKMYGIEMDSILEMQHVQGDRPTQFCLSYYSKTALQNHLAVIEQKLHVGELHQTSVTPAIGEFIIGFAGNIFRGSVLSVHCGKIVAFDIDTGALKILNECDSWEIGDCLSQLPPQAIQCKLWSMLDNLEWCQFLNNIFKHFLSKCNLVVTIKGVIPGKIPTFLVDVDAHDMNELVDFNISEWIKEYVLPITEKIELLGLTGSAKDGMLEDTDPYKIYREEDCSDSDSFKGSLKYVQKDADSSHDVHKNSISNAISNCVVVNGEKMPVRDVCELNVSSTDDYSGQLDRNVASNSSLNIVERTEDFSNDMNLFQDAIEQICQKETDQPSSKILSNSSPQTVTSAVVKCFLENEQVLGMSFLKGEDPWNFILHYVPKQEIALLKMKISAKGNTGVLVPFLNGLHGGDFAIGKYGNEFCRVRIIDVSVMENIRVLDIDSGETLFLSQYNLWVLEEAFSLPPALAIHCSLWNITRKPFYWNTGLQKLFKKVMTATPLSVKVKRIENIAGNWRHIVKIKVIRAIEFDISEWIMMCVFPKLNEIRLIFDKGHSIDSLNLDPTKMFSEEPIVSASLQHSKCTQSVLIEADSEVCGTVTSGSVVSKLQNTTALPRSAEIEDHFLDLSQDSDKKKADSSKFQSKRYYKEFDFTKPSYEVKCGTKYYVFMSYILSPSEFYVHIVSEENSSIDNMSEEIEKYCLSSNISYGNKSEANQFILQCCAVYYTNRWCRGRIVDWLDNSTDDVQVFLVDYGIHATVSFHSIQPLRSDFYKQPIIAQRCSLAHILPPNDDDNWPQRSLDGFLSVLDYNTVYEIYIESFAESEETFNVFLTSGEGKEVVSINDYLVDEGLAVPHNSKNVANGSELCHLIDCPVFDKGMEGLSDEEDTWGDRCGIRNREIMSYFDNNTAGLPRVGEQLSVVITEVRDFGSFYGVLSKCDYNGRQFNTHDALTIMHSKIKSAVQLGQLKSAVYIVPGTIAIAQYSEDKQWYRVRVLTHLDESGFVDVFFVDFGNVVTIHEKFVKEMRSDFCSPAFQAMQFFMDKIDKANFSDKYAQEKGVQLLSALIGNEVVVNIVREVNEDIIVEVLHDAKDVVSEMLQLYHRECRE